MQRQSFFTIGSALSAALAFGAAANAQCDSYIDFEDYAEGTSITTQYPGVTFSSQPDPGCPPPEIEIVPAGTSSGVNSLYVPHCPEFSTNYLRMVFDDSQAFVTFTFAEWGTPDYPMKIRAYNASGVSVFDDMILGGNGVVRLAVIGSMGGPRNIKRVEVETLVIGAWECIDDLRFGVPDNTPPIARIDSPTYGGCVCGDIVITGLACDDDGAYGYDRLEYRSVSAAPDAPWIFHDEVIGSPVCESDYLYTLETDAIPHGRYWVRLTAVNACGLESVAFTSVFIDKQFGNVLVASPPDDANVCGTVEFTGTVNDGCQCFDSYTVEFSDAVGGPYEPVDPGNAVYTVDVKNGLLASWDTIGQGLPNDTYYIRITGYDSCGNTDQELMKVHLMNGPLCGCPADVNGNGEIEFQDLLQLLGSWGPCPS